MRSIFLAAAFLFPVFSLFALRSGDKTVELAGVKWLQGGPVRMDFPGQEKKHYRVAVFLLTNAANASGNLQMLDHIQQKYGKQLRIAVVTPDPESDARRLLSTRRQLRFSFGVDRERKITAQYMGGSMLFPMAFVASAGGNIIWNGEVVDLDEFLESAMRVPVDVDRQKQISALLEELQGMLRDNAHRKMRLLADRIFQLDPGNAAAMRMLLFVLENSGRIPEAWQVVSRQMDSAPGKARIYYTALDMISRYPFLGRELPGTVNRFLLHISDVGACDLAVWTLLTRFEFNPEALSGAVRIFEAAGRIAGKKELAPEIRAGHSASAALLAARLGQFGKAAELQKQTVRYYLDAGNPAAAAAAEKLIRYYELCGKTSVKW